MRSTTAPLAVTALLAASCSAFFPPGNPVDFCVEQAGAWCDLQFKCCTAVERRADPLGVFNGRPTARRAPSDPGECLGVMTDLCRGTVDAQNESLVEERITYDADEAADCLADMRTAIDECDPEAFFDAQGSYLSQLLDNGRPGVLGDGCDNAIEGAVEENDECFASYECEKGACVVNSGDITAEGECQGSDTPQNPFENNFDFEICDGLEDE